MEFLPRIQIFLGTGGGTAPGDASRSPIWGDPGAGGRASIVVTPVPAAGDLPTSPTGTRRSSRRSMRSATRRGLSSSTRRSSAGLRTPRPCRRRVWLAHLVVGADLGVGTVVEERPFAGHSPVCGTLSRLRDTLPFAGHSPVCGTLSRLRDTLPFAGHSPWRGW